MPLSTPPIQRGRLVVGGTTHYTLPGVCPSGTVGSAVLTAGQDRFMPILVETPITLDQLALEVTSAGAGGTTLRMAIYNADGSWQPTTLVVDAGTVAADGNGVKTATISTTLAPGRYLLAVNSDGTPTLRTIRGSIPNMFINSAFSGNALILVMRNTRAYAAFPATATAIDTVTASSVGIEYSVVCRVSTP